MTQYLFKWKDYGSEYNEWQNIMKLDNCLKLVERYKTFIANALRIINSIETR